MPARFYQQDIDAKLKDKRKLSAWLDGLINKHLKDVKKISLSYIFCTDAYLLSINRQFLQHDTLTDIITFDMSEKDSELLGEIYISVERVRENAEKFAVGYKDELHRVIFHGALHLCGYGDKKAADKQEMHRMEDKCLRAYFKD
jgi:rRNA maturation RNase YbeY